MDQSTETQRLLNEYVNTPEDDQTGIVMITGVTDPTNPKATEVIISMEGDARFLLRVLCDAQLKLLKEYKNDKPVTNAYKKAMLPILEELADPETVDRIQKKLNHVPFWDLVGQLRKFTR